MFYQWQDRDLILKVRIQPKASSDAFAEVLDARLKIRITAPPVDGKANKQLTAFLAKQFKVSKSRIHILSGDAGRNKRIKISNPKQIPNGLLISNECERP